MQIMKRAGITLLVSMALCSVASASSFNTNLSIGTKGDAVKVLQDFLIAKGLLAGPSTSYFGEQTKKAVQAFQKSNNLPTTGGWYALTRQKANLLADSTQTSIPQVSSTSTEVTVTNSVISSSKKEVTLKIENKGGLIYYPDNTIACHNFETCKKTFRAGTSIKLRAEPAPGYIFAGWSEASCGLSLECSVPLIDDTTVYTTFKIRDSKRVGKIVYPTSSDVCYVGMGQETCNVPVYWINDTGLDMTLRVNGADYVIGVEDQNDPQAKYPVNPDAVLNPEPKNAVGPIYFPLTPEIQTIELRSGGQTLDTVKMTVKCADGLYFQYGRKCWQDGAKSIYIFKDPGILVKSDVTGIACGYKLEKCAAAFASSTKVTLTVTALPGYVFSGWYGDCSGKSSTCTLTMDKDKTVGVK